MTYRMTVVLEYPSKDRAPRISAKTLGKDLGDGEVVSLQFSDALRELEVLTASATDEAKRAGWLAAENYPQKQPAQETGSAPQRACSWAKEGNKFNCHTCGSFAVTTLGRDEIIADCQHRPTANR